MEGCFIDERKRLSRVEVDRYLRSYKRMNVILRSSRAFEKSLGEQTAQDEAAIQAEMYALRALILSVEDVRERMLLYHYYIKGQTLDACARLLGISRRSVYRLKSAALDSMAQRMKNAEK